MGKFRKSSLSSSERPYGQHRFEHWYRDNTVYFITARCRHKFSAFASEAAQLVFWNRFDHYAQQYGFVPFVTSLMSNHYHSLGYLKVGEQLGQMMRRLHGSVAKLVNDLLPERLTHFWYDTGKQGYFDGCIRDEMQCRRAYEYTLTQCTRHKICPDWHRYPNTHVNLDINAVVKRAIEKHAFMDGVPYERYAQERRARFSISAVP
jgi:hypothetical protein